MDENNTAKNELILALLIVTLSAVFFGILGLITQYFLIDPYIDLFHKGITQEAAKQKLWADVLALGMLITIVPLWMLNKERKRVAGIIIDGLLLCVGIISFGLLLGIGLNLSSILA